jgi:hypothetical protein
MLQEATNTQQDSATATIEKEQQIYDIILHELIRQVYVECADRGVLLEHVSKRYRSLFRKIPALLSQMQDQIDNLTGANKSLRMVLERLMEEKNSSGETAKSSSVNSTFRKQVHGIKFQNGGAGATEQTINGETRASSTTTINIQCGV